MGWIDYESQQLFTDELFSNVLAVKTKWQDKFKLIFVDEYQDTDPIQYRIVKTLAESHQNLRVVGDDDQGIYGWRGADIQNILNFEKDYPNAKIISLGQNYRSTQNIVETSRALADFNPNRREKELFTRNYKGEKVKYFHCENNEEEAATIAAFIQRSVDQGDWHSNDFAVLYRTNKQAHAFRKALSDLEIECHVVRDSLETHTNGVIIMTIYKSKGLEFPNVFVTGICKDLLPHYYNRDEKDWPEELRLLYVAMTRAKNWLCLSSYETDVESQHERGQSPFLKHHYIPPSLLESLEDLQNVSIPPIPPEIPVPGYVGETSEYIEPLPERLLGNGMTVLGVDPGIRNVGWSITQKSSTGYNVLKYGTNTTMGWQETYDQTKNIISELITQYRPDAIAVEKLEGATEYWFLYVAGCVATIRSIADQHGIEFHLYTPQHVKYIATGFRDASKEDVQIGVKRMCNLLEIPEPHHSADAIATSLCYLRSYLNSFRFEGNKRKMELYNTGCEYIDKRQFGTAIDVFKETLHIDPIYTDAFVGMGRAHLAQSDLERAVNAAEKALRLTDNSHLDSQNLLDAITKYRSGCSSLKNEEWNFAIDNFKEAINREPIFIDAHCGLSKACIEIGNLEDAKNTVEEALNITHDYLPARELLDKVKMKSYYKGKTYYNSKEYDHAIIELQRSVTIDNDFKGAHLLLGKTYFKLGNLEAAETGVKEALRIDATYESASELLTKIKQKHKEQGDIHRNRQLFIEAVNSYQRAIRIDYKYKEVYNNLGIVYRNMKEYSKAINSFQEAISIDGNYEEPYNNLSIVYLEIKEFTKAVSSLKHAITLKPDNPTAFRNLAITYFKMRNLPDACKTLLKSLSLDANNQKTLKLQEIIRQATYKHGQSYYVRGDLASAELFAKRALELGSSYQPAMDLLKDIKQSYYSLARANIENTNYIAGINLLKKSMEIDPDFIDGLYLLGETYFSMGELKGAEIEVRKVLHIDPNYEPASSLLISIKVEYYKLGLTSLEQNKWEHAEKFTEEALRIDPNYQLAFELLKQIHYDHGLNHINNGTYEKSIYQLLKSNNIDPNCEKTHYYLGLAYFKIDKLKEAQLSIKRALSIQPNYLQAWKLLSEINHPRNWLKLGVANVQHFTRRILKLNRD